VLPSTWAFPSGATALRQADSETADVFKDFTEVGLGDTPAADIWRPLMAVPGYFFHSQTAEKVRDEGGVRREAELILRALTTRGIEVTDADRDRITGCTDPGTLDRWFDRAITVTTAEALFADA